MIPCTHTHTVGVLRLTATFGVCGAVADGSKKVELRAATRYYTTRLSKRYAYIKFYNSRVFDENAPSVLCMWAGFPRLTTVGPRFVAGPYANGYIHHFNNSEPLWLYSLPIGRVIEVNGSFNNEV